MSQSAFSESDLKPASSLDSLVTSARRSGYSEAVSDLYKAFKELSKGDTLTSDQLSIMTTMLQNEVYKFIPQDSNAYDHLDKL